MTVTPEAHGHNSDLTTYTRWRRATELRRWAVTDAVGYIVLGSRELAYDRLLESVLGEQAHLAGIRVPCHG